MGNNLQTVLNTFKGHDVDFAFALTDSKKVVGKVLNTGTDFVVVGAGERSMYIPFSAIVHFAQSTDTDPAFRAG